MRTDSLIPELLTGIVERVTFHNPQNGFCVLRVKTKAQRDLATVLGSAPNIAAGESIEAEGNWFNDKTHGLQFKAQQLRTILPTSLEGIEKYLGSGMVKGVGPHMAKKLVQKFGERVFEVIEEDPKKLTKLPGIGKKRAETILASWAEQKAIRDIMIFLQGHGVGTARAVRIYKTYGDESIPRVRENPYRLAQDVYGIGFKIADDLAQKLGIARDSPLRAAAGVRYALQHLSSEGHVCVLQETLVEKCVELLEISESIIQKALLSEVNLEHVVAEDSESGRWFFLPHLHEAECAVAARLKKLNQGSLPWKKINAKTAIPAVEKETGLELSLSQKAALEKALHSKVMIITGGPGVGKTTVVNSLLKILQKDECTVALCAPTGRAAKRLSESTGLVAKTIHRLLEFKPDTNQFFYDEHQPLKVDVLVVDETSMLDIVLMNALLKAVPKEAALFLVGDVDQLPSVGPGMVLSDLIQSKAIPTVALTEIFRQAASSKIIVNAHRINQGENLVVSDSEALSDFYFIPAQSAEEIHDKVVMLVSDRIPKRFNLDPIRDIQVLTPMNKGGVGTKVLNNTLQAKLNGASTQKITRFGDTFAVGDKVIQQVNNYDKEVFNGDIGQITALNLETNQLEITFDARVVPYETAELDEISLAYATSIHKSQGSEYPAVVIPLAVQHYRMLVRNLLYTGVTRGKKLVVIVGEEKALAMAIRTVQAGKRQTRLKERLLSSK